MRSQFLPICERLGLADKAFSVVIRVARLEAGIMPLEDEPKLGDELLATPRPCALDLLDEVSLPVFDGPQLRSISATPLASSCCSDQPLPHLGPQAARRGAATKT
jgi:hypothetical protein